MGRQPAPRLLLACTNASASDPARRVPGWTISSTASETAVGLFRFARVRSSPGPACSVRDGGTSASAPTGWEQKCRCVGNLCRSGRISAVRQRSSFAAAPSSRRSRAQRQRGACYWCIPSAVPRTVGRWRSQRGLCPSHNEPRTGTREARATASSSMLLLRTSSRSAHVGYAGRRLRLTKRGSARGTATGSVPSSSPRGASQ